MRMSQDQVNDILNQFLSSVEIEKQETISDEFIPATIDYPHESKFGAAHEPPIEQFEPSDQSRASVQKSNSIEPRFALTKIEEDLGEVLRYVLEEKNQTLLTVENIFLQQLLRVVQRIEEKVDWLEEYIADEVVNVSQDPPVQDSNRRLLVAEPEDNDQTELMNLILERMKDGQKETSHKKEYHQEKKSIQTVEQNTREPEVRNSGGAAKAKRKNAGKRRRNRGNNKNRR